MADPSTGVGAETWRDIDTLAALVGAYCWVERRLFALTGEWASGPGIAEGQGPRAEARVWCAAASSRHGDRAGRWAERLPVRAGVDVAALVEAPSGPLGPAFDALAAEPDPDVGLAALVEAVLPGIDAVYAAHLAVASPVREGPVMEVLTGAHREVRAEIRGGRTLIGAFPQALEGKTILRKIFEQAFNETRVFPAVRTS